MAILKLPALAENVGSATLVRWLKRPGEQFVAGEQLAELEVEEAVVVLTAGSGGQLAELLVSPGMTVTVGAELAQLDASPGALPATGSSHRQTDASSHPQIEAGLPGKSVAGKRKVENRSSGDAGEVIPVLMPQAGNTMEEGTVVEWRLKEGDRVAAGQILCEIETDKATMEFESPSAGRLARIIAKVGEPVAVKGLIAVLAESDAAAAAFVNQEDEAVQAAPLATASIAVARTDYAPLAAAFSDRQTEAGLSSSRPKASPAARKAAAERGVALGSLGAGSGPGGRILSFDVPSGGGGAKPASGEGRRRPMSKMRRAIGVNLQRSKQTVPHFYVRVTINADPLLAYQEAEKPRTGCSLNDCVVLAVGRAMRDFPAVRSQVDGDHIVEFPHANIGIAVGVDDGLVVPVVLQVDTLSLAELATETKRVVQAGRKGVLENVGKGNFTISNLGMFGVEEFGAIINPPESGILAVSAVREAAVVKDGAMSPGRVMTMTLSADHRVVDGVLAAKFVKRLKDILEHPAEELG